MCISPFCEKHFKPNQSVAIFHQERRISLEADISLFPANPESTLTV
jgi:hypothetical protein